jgi:hypothetical protein
VSYITRARTPMPKSTAEYIERCPTTPRAAQNGHKTEKKEA